MDGHQNYAVGVGGKAFKFANKVLIAAFLSYSLEKIL